MSDLDRLTAVGKLWTAVKFFHPYLASSKGIDWDAALITGLSKVRAASDTIEYASAIQQMLNALGDPSTRVRKLKSPDSTALKDGAAFVRQADNGILIVTFGAFADTDWAAAMAAISKLRKL